MFTPDVFGSPGTARALRVMLLGSGELGKEVTIAFQRLGVEVIAVDRYDSAPAHLVANFVSVIDMTDAEELRRLVEASRPDVIVPEIEMLATDELARIEADGLATVVPTARAAQLTMDREGIRRLAAEELGLPTSPYRFVDCADDCQTAAAEVGWPCVIKPVMSSSGKGQSVVRAPEDVAAAYEHAVSAGRGNSPRVIVEGFVEFDREVTILTVRSVDPATGGEATWFCEPIGHTQSDGDYVESWQPEYLSPTALDAARSIAARITTAVGGRGVFGVELFIAGQDVYFNEVSPRPHDTGMVTMASQRRSEFELHARAVLGLPVDVTLTSPGASAVIRADRESHAPAFTGLGEALAVPESDVRLFGKPTCTAGRRMGVALATAEDTETARERARAAAGAITQIAQDDDPAGAENP